MKNLDELRKIKEEVRKSMEMRSGGQRVKVVIGMGTCGIAAGARDTMKAFMDFLDAEKISDVAVTATGCAGFCEREPVVDVEVQGQKPVRYAKVDREAVMKIVKQHIQGGKVVQELVFA
ncbi:MAG TPA: 2Fe-2S ferredoxin [Lentisphaeria bacterium]|nr:MAG: NADH dehydrogenase [Lentisphaerae bacterium GWF2_49_21]HBC85428.1 2Fe-2S ferredoxin [Lentisphaeria bacterium]